MSNGHLKTDNYLNNIDQEEVKLKVCTEHCNTLGVLYYCNWPFLKVIITQEKSASEEGKEKEKRRRERKDQRDKEKR